MFEILPYMKNGLNFPNNNIADGGEVANYVMKLTLFHRI